MLEFMKKQTLDGKTVKGYVQCYSIRPFYVSLYTQTKLKILKRLIDYNKSTVLHLDSTGTVSATLPREYGEKRQFYYALVVRLIGAKDTSIVPLLEFISNSQSVITISAVLHHFFSA